MADQTSALGDAPVGANAGVARRRAAVEDRGGMPAAMSGPLSTLGTHTVLTVYALIVLLPLLMVVYLSFKDIAGILGTPLSPPSQLHPENYTTAWVEGGLGRFLINTIVVAGVSVAMILAFSSLAAFVIARYRFRGNQLLYLFFISGMALPIQIVALPIFVMIRNLHLLDSLWALILVFSSGGISFSMFILVNFMRTVPGELQEAAVMDGAGPMGIYWHVVLPLIRPAIGIVAIFQFITAWKEFFLPLLLVQNPQHMTVAVGMLSFVGEHTTEWQLLLAALVIVSLPTLIGFLLVSKQFQRNLTAGAIKS
jgi:raffinose/stachyose/melibiose transport system permease protein